MEALAFLLLSLGAASAQPAPRPREAAWQKRVSYGEIRDIFLSKGRMPALDASLSGFYEVVLIAKKSKDGGTFSSDGVTWGQEASNPDGSPQRRILLIQRVGLARKGEEKKFAAGGNFMAKSLTASAVEAEQDSFAFSAAQRRFFCREVFRLFNRPSQKTFLCALDDFDTGDYMAFVQRISFPLKGRSAGNGGLGSGIPKK